MLVLLVIFITRSYRVLHIFHLLLLILQSYVTLDCPFVLRTVTGHRATSLRIFIFVSH